MNPLKISFFLMFLGVLTSCTPRNVSLKSPSDTLQAIVQSTENGLSLDLVQDGEKLIKIDIGEFSLDGSRVGSAYQVENVKYHTIDEAWKPVYGERNAVRNNYRSFELKLKNETEGLSLKLECRVYDEGIAFRYLFNESDKYSVLNQEGTAFNFDADYEAWLTHYAQGEYRKLHLSEIEKACERPLLIQRNESSFLAIGEAALVDFARMKMVRNTEKNHSLRVELSGEVNLKKAEYKSPWRYVMVAQSAAKLLENNFFVLNLNEPNKIEDVSWIKPGKVIREVTLSTQGGIACIDFARKHNLQYVEFDAGWYGNEYDDRSDAMTITVDPRRSPGPLDLHRIIEYGKQHGIGVILYVNRRALEKQLDELLPLYKSWGVAGLKYGFVNVGSQEWTSWLHEAVRKAAKYQLMVDVHDEYRPTGYSRTYPNLMTQEGIRGDEESTPNDEVITSIFTRMIAGAGDQTNCYFAPRVSEKMGSHASQMAKTISVYSPWQFLYWYDRPEGSPHKDGGAGGSQGIIQEIKDLKFYDELPVVWDDTRVLDGYPGKYVSIVRRKEDRWYLGVLAGKESYHLELKLDFLEEDMSYKAILYFDDPSMNTLTNVRIREIEVNSESVLKQKIFEQNGLAVVFKPLD